MFGTRKLNQSLFAVVLTAMFFVVASLAVSVSRGSSAAESTWGGAGLGRPANAALQTAPTYNTFLKSEGNAGPLRFYFNTANGDYLFMVATTG